MIRSTRQSRGALHETHSRSGHRLVVIRHRRVGTNSSVRAAGRVRADDVAGGEAGVRRRKNDRSLLYRRHAAARAAGRQWRAQIVLAKRARDPTATKRKTQDEAAT